MLIKRLFFWTALTLTTTQVCAQGDVADSTLRMSLFQFQAAGYHTSGDVGDLYGPFAGVGFSYAYKSATNVLLGADFMYLFGDRVKNSDNLLRELRTSAGFVIDREGEFVNFLLQHRGVSAGFYAGKIFPVIGPNPNSGLEVRLGVEYLEHRTRIETRQDDFPPLEGDALKGYDRKRAGIAVSQFVGYRHFSNSRFANFFVGLEVKEGFTTDYRSYNIDEMRYTEGDYFDLFVGIRVGWVLPVYKRMADKFYIN